MQVVLLAGGLGTRLQEETTARPKPMVEIGGQPILWHIMKGFARYGHDDFLVACGYMGNFIKRYFLDQYHLAGDLKIDFGSDMTQRSESEVASWSVNLIDTGLDTMTGGRLLRLQDKLRRETFMLTYGDGVSDINIDDLVAFHRQQGLLATVTAVRPPARFGGLIVNGDTVEQFTEKPTAGEGWINGGFLVFEPEIFKYLKSDQCSLEANALEQVAAAGQLAAYRHDGFWQCMDTLRDKHYLQKLWDSGDAPWMRNAVEQPKRLRVMPARQSVS
ncbi:glucose-1-phosphate cytidylyltransferase [Allorhodopirellula solitaria]|uniref:Glucose-1-phosphate cytidylyltransferase n=1 Tax=Allorhodopirellula solitaria TaxID=2527987 RepID=A0A5C5X0M3_9BACT|nr:glucose-1-phosphate cytidylyltransferase [Allorhodopirellula solitaria]TWT56360.1 Glucose-1-phosphate cytidylyltransferase [Allorhodopirellula solitaria]